MIALIIIVVLATTTLVGMGIIIGSKKEKPKVLAIQLADRPNVRLAVETFSKFAKMAYRDNTYAIHRCHTFSELTEIIEKSYGHNIILYSHGDKEKGIQIDGEFIAWMTLIDLVLEHRETDVLVLACYSGYEWGITRNYFGWESKLDAEYAGWLGAHVFAYVSSRESADILGQPLVSDLAQKKQDKMLNPLAYDYRRIPLPQAVTSQLLIKERYCSSEKEMNIRRRQDQNRFGNAWGGTGVDDSSVPWGFQDLIPPIPIHVPIPWNPGTTIEITFGGTQFFTRKANLW
jgi:hypothetical protein